MARVARGASEANLRVVYTRLVVAPMVYGMGVWYPGLSMKRKEELQVVANTGVRVIKRQPITCRREVMWHQARVATVEMMAKKSRMTLAERHSE